MPYYKDKNNNVHFLDSSEFVKFLPEGSVEITEDKAKSINESKYTDAEVKGIIISAIQEKLDAFAKSRDYDNIMSVCSYANSTVPQWAAEGQYCVQMRDTYWLIAEQFLNNYLSGIISRPSMEEVIAALPELVWPEV